MGTGLKKCMPMNLSARPVTAASLVIEMDEVLGNQHLGAHQGIDFLQDLDFQGFVFRGRLNHQLGCLQSAVIGADGDFCQGGFFIGGADFFFLISRSRLPATVAKPFCTAASEISTITTLMPKLAHAWAVPLRRPWCPRQ